MPTAKYFRLHPGFLLNPDKYYINNEDTMQKNIDFGSFPDDPSADPIRSAFQKTQENFTEIFKNQQTTGVSSINKTAGAGVTVNRPTGDVILSANIACVQFYSSSLSVTLLGSPAVEPPSNATIIQSSQTMVIDLPSNISGVNNIAVTSNITANNFIGNGAALTGNISVGNIATSGILTLGGNATGALQAIPLQQLEKTVGLVNRAINGDFNIDLWNLGATALITQNTQYLVDRWFAQSFPTNVFQGGQLGDTPPGFRVSLAAATTNPINPPAAHLYTAFRQLIEGSIIRDCLFGSAQARMLAVSFFVSSSLTGTHAFAVSNSQETRSYVTSYTVNAANTWEYKTILIPGDVAGVWDLDLGNAIAVGFDYGSGSNRETATPNTWVSGYSTRFSGCVRHVETSSGRLRIAGFQVLVNNAAVPFIPRLPPQELVLCRRYMQRYEYPPLRGVVAAGGQPARLGMVLPVQMRGIPQVLFIGSLTVSDGSTTGTVNATSTQYNRFDSIEIDCPIVTGGPLTVGRPCLTIAGSGSILVTAEYYT